MNRQKKIYYLDRVKIETNYHSIKEFSIEKEINYTMVLAMINKGLKKRSTLNRYPQLEGYFIEKDVWKLNFLLSKLMLLFVAFCCSKCYNIPIKLIFFIKNYMVY